MTDIIKIAFTGKLRSGKSLAASYLNYEYDYRIASFGTSLKYYAEAIFADSSLYRSEKITEPCPFVGERVVGQRKPRKLYQDFGTAMRALDPDIWVNSLAGTVARLEDSRSTIGIVIDDLRQENEFEWCRANGFTIIRVTAPEDVRLERARIAGDDFDTDSLSHETESHSDGFNVDYEIMNDGSRGDLERQIGDILSEIMTNSNEREGAIE